MESERRGALCLLTYLCLDSFYPQPNPLINRRYNPLSAILMIANLSISFLFPSSLSILANNGTLLSA